MSFLPAKPKTVGERSLEITKAYLQKGNTVSRSAWIKVSPKHPLLKAVLALPMAAIAITMLILFLIALGFTLLAVGLIMAISRAGKHDTEDSN